MPCCRRWLLSLLAAAVGCPAALAEAPSPAANDFFEKEVRPLLVERCFKCHAGRKSKGGLKLDSRAAILEGGETGPAAVPGKPGRSLLVRAVRYHDKPKMPPRKPLPDREVRTLTRWVEMGLPWPETVSGHSGTAAGGRAFRITDEQRKFWCFQPVKPVRPPAVRDVSWPRSEIDRFILGALEARMVEPAEPADKRTLIRRATFDLTGLPPSPEEVAAFLADRSPEAFARVVDRLLASLHYGERWGRHWLDVVRYTDSFDARGRGGEGDIADAYRYRDWVIDAFNRDLPYDQFIMNQVAGDLLPAPGPGGVNKAGIIATGMLAIGNWGGGDADKEKLLTDIADDQVDVVSRTFLGLTMACARCHDHKFDPISNADYYALAGIFFSTHILPNVGPKTNVPPMLFIPLASKAELAARQRYASRLTALEKQLKSATEEEYQAFAHGLLPQTARLGKLRQELTALKRDKPPPLLFANGAQEGGVPGSPHAGVHDVRIHIRGSYARLGERVPRRFPTILAGEHQKPITHGSGRLELARWLVSPEHPLTARVMVNRIWQHHFGEGIVATPSNFGKLGERPTNPELLDWLARRFVESGWSMKAMHRAMMLSAAYQQSSRPRPQTLKADPDNHLFGRMNRRRLEAELIRDNLLAVAGRLDRSGGGPATPHFNSPRRTVYLMTVRSDRSGFRPLFDVADPTALVDKRTVSTVAPQALFLLNHPFVLAQTRALTGRLLAAGTDDRKRIEAAYGLLYGRPPTARETQVGLDFLAQADGDAPHRWQEYCQVLVCANEFIYVD